MINTVTRSSRHGTAAVEMAVITPFLLVLIVGIWELGRIIQVQQILNNAVRDGARVASQGQVINLVGAFTEIHATTGTPNIQATVTEYLQVAGLTNLNGSTVQFQFVSGDTTLTDPYQGSKNQQFKVRVTLPYNNVRWTNLTLINPTTLSAECTWTMLVDDPFTISTSIPFWYPIANQ